MYTDILYHAYKSALLTNQCNVAKHQVEISPEYRAEKSNLLQGLGHSTPL